jgi:hypothetical protein
MKGHAHAGPACCYRDVQLVARGLVLIKKLASSDFLGGFSQRTDCEDYCRQESSGSSTFRRNVLSPSSVLENKWLCLLVLCIYHCLTLYLRAVYFPCNFCKLLSDYITSRHRRLSFSTLTTSLLQPTKCQGKDEAPDLKAEDVIMRCVIRVVSHLRVNDRR